MKIIKKVIQLFKKKKYDIDTIDFTHPDLKGMGLHTKALPNGRYEVNGVVLDAADMIDANRKYLRHKRTENMLQ